MPRFREVGQARGIFRGQRGSNARDELYGANASCPTTTCGTGEDGVGGHLPFSRFRTRRRAFGSTRLAGRIPGGVRPQGFRAHAARGRAENARGELVDIMDVGYTCTYLATLFARRVTDELVCVDGSANRVA